ncbi:helicase RepA family protein [Methylocystis sp.]|uniref:helicase RepA family protein n=1 Tax=Methylocystis sp. TaxID=1911079 RepID=UPI0025DDA22D|nr:helicase RepA family protein [Methylocystis sp.]
MIERPDYMTEEDWRAFLEKREREANCGRYFEEPEGAYIPPIGEPAQPQGNGHDRRAQPSRKMQFEWFDDACDAALAESHSRQLIDGLLDEGAFSVIYGEPGSAKTFFALDTTFCVSTGLPWNGKPTKRGLVVYVAAEGGRRIQRRLAALKKRYVETHGVNAPRPLFALVRHPIDLRSNDANLKELLALVRQTEAETGEKCVWIVVDTLSRALAGGDENSPADMGRVVMAADRIRTETDAHFSYVHHSGKDAARGARGHSLLRAATDSEIEVTPGALKVTKQRDLEGGQTFGFQLVDVTIGEDADGKPIKSAVIEWTDAPTKAERASKAKSVPPSERLLMECVAQAIDEAGEMHRLFPDGPLVKVISDDFVRRRYYARIAERPKDGDTPEKLAVRQRQAFNRAIQKNLDAKRLCAAEKNGARVLWLP